MYGIDIDPAAYLAATPWWRNGLDRLRRVPGSGLGTLGVAAATLIMGFGAGASLGNMRAERVRENVELQHSRADLLAGELALEQLRMERLTHVQDYSARYHIPADLAGVIYDMAVSEAVDPAVAYELVSVESGFRQHAVSAAGAVGYTQIKPSTARWLDPSVSADGLFDTATNLRLGFRYLQTLLDAYDQNAHLALLAYNRGPARVAALLSSGRDPSNGYARAVLAGAE